MQIFTNGWIYRMNPIIYSINGNKELNAHSTYRNAVKHVYV